MSMCRIAIITKYCKKEYIYHIAVIAPPRHNTQWIAPDAVKPNTSHHFVQIYSQRRDGGVDANESYQAA